MPQWVKQRFTHSRTHNDQPPPQPSHFAATHTPDPTTSEHPIAHTAVCRSHCLHDGSHVSSSSCRPHVSTTALAIVVQCMSHRQSAPRDLRVHGASSHLLYSTGFAAAAHSAASPASRTASLMPSIGGVTGAPRSSTFAVLAALAVAAASFPAECFVATDEGAPFFFEQIHFRFPRTLQPLCSHRHSLSRLECSCRRSHDFFSLRHTQVFFHFTSRSTRPFRSRGSHGRINFLMLGCCNRIRSFLTASHDTGALGRQCSSELVSLFAAPWPRAHTARKRGLPDHRSVTPHCFK